jgi:hypothetical protein
MPLPGAVAAVVKTGNTAGALFGTDTRAASPSSMCDLFGIEMGYFDADA